MIDKTYKCNFCKDPKDVSELIGLCWGYHTINKRNGWLLHCNPNLCENHICGDCLSDLNKPDWKLK